MASHEVSFNDAAEWYQTVCTCGWVSDERFSDRQAWGEAEAHLERANYVSPEQQRIAELEARVEALENCLATRGIEVMEKLARALAETDARPYSTGVRMPSLNFRRGASHIREAQQRARQRATLTDYIEDDLEEWATGLPSIPEDLADELWLRHEEEAALEAAGMDCYGSLQ